jgi:hypothetical protein
MTFDTLGSDAGIVAGLDTGRGAGMGTTTVSVFVRPSTLLLAEAAAGCPSFPPKRRPPYLKPMNTIIITNPETTPIRIRFLTLRLL